MINVTLIWSYYLVSIHSANNVAKKMTSEEAFAYFLDNKLSQSVYENTHKEAPCRFPSYRAIIEIKNECSLIKTLIDVTETKAKDQLQDLMDYTSKCLVKLQEKGILKYLNDRKKDSDKLITNFVVGDGSSSLSKYHQSFNNSIRNNLKDSDLLVTARSPLRLYVHSDPNNIRKDPNNIKKIKKLYQKLRRKLKRKFLIYIPLKFVFQDISAFRSNINLSFQ